MTIAWLSLLSNTSCTMAPTHDEESGFPASVDSGSEIPTMTGENVDEPTVPVETGTKVATVADFGFGFAWDNELREIVSPVIDGQPAMSAIVIVLYGEGGLIFTKPEDICHIRLDVSGFVPETNIPEGSGIQWQLRVAPGFYGPADDPQFPNGQKPVTTDCIERGFTNAQYPGTPGGLVEFWGSLPWVISVLEGEVSDRLYNIEIEPFLSPKIAEKSKYLPALLNTTFFEDEKT